MNNNKLTFDQHAILGANLKTIDANLAGLTAQMSEVYGETCDERILVDKAIAILSQLRARLEDRAWHEHPERQREALRLYYARSIAKSA